MSMDKYPCRVLHKMEVIVYIHVIMLTVRKFCVPLCHQSSTLRPEHAGQRVFGTVKSPKSKNKQTKKTGQVNPGLIAQGKYM